MDDKTTHFTPADRLILNQVPVIISKLDRAIDDIRELKDNFAGRLKTLEDVAIVNKTTIADNEAASRARYSANKEVVDDHEIRIRRIETWVWLAIGGLTILEFIINVYVLYHK